MPAIGLWHSHISPEGPTLVMSRPGRVVVGGFLTAARVQEPQAPDWPTNVTSGCHSWTGAVTA